MHGTKLAFQWSNHPCVHHVCGNKNEMWCYGVLWQTNGGGGLVLSQAKMTDVLLSSKELVYVRLKDRWPQSYNVKDTAGYRDQQGIALLSVGGVWSACEIQQNLASFVGISRTPPCSQNIPLVVPAFSDL